MTRAFPRLPGADSLHDSPPDVAIHPVPCHAPYVPCSTFRFPVGTTL